MTALRKLKPKTCRECRSEFEPMNSLQVTCSPKCALAYTVRRREEKALAEKRKREKIQRAKDAQWKLDNKPTRQLVKEAQDYFNKWVRLRDKHEDCPSCDKTREEIEIEQGWKTGGAWDCGHYLTVGAHPELRFHEDNAHKQCKKCNGGAGKYVTFAKKRKSVSARYRETLLEKIGLERVEWLEGPHEPRKYTREELIAIKEKYKRKAKELESYDHEMGI